MNDHDFREVMPAPTYQSHVRMAFHTLGRPRDNSALEFATDLETKYANGRAWRVDIDQVMKNTDAKPGSHAVIDWWVIEAPWAHPIWHSYSMTLVHLRPMPTNFGDDLAIHVPGATHEMLLYALDPKGDRAKMLELGYSKESCLPLLPGNFAAQLVEASDYEAAQRIEDTVKDVCDGLLSPDTDHLRDWIKRFGDGMVRKSRPFNPLDHEQTK